MLILGIDPGSRKTGYALLEHKGSRLFYKASGVMSYEKEKVFIHRLGYIYESMLHLVETYKPESIALESLIHVKNITGLVKLSQTRGAMLAAFMKNYRGKVFEYAPNMIKQSVTGYGHASKEEVARALTLLFRSVDGPSFQTDDESDALAIAVCHSVVGGHRGEVERHRGRTIREAFKHLR